MTQEEEVMVLRERVSKLEQALRAVGEYVKWSNPRSLSRRDKEAKLLALHVIVSLIPSEEKQQAAPAAPLAHPVNPAMGEVIG